MQPLQDPERPRSDAEIEALVRGLDNLCWNLQVQADILALGRRAVPALVRFLHGPRLLDALRVHRLLGAAEALLEFREEAALPWLVEGLEDAFKRDRFAQMILEFGLPAIPHLAGTLNRRRMHGEEELLPSRERRAAALKLFGLLQAREAREAIRAALQDPYDAVRTEAAIALALLGEWDSLGEVGPVLIAGLTHPDFLQRDRCAEALRRLGPGCVPILEQALAEGGIMVGVEAVPLTVNARSAALSVLEALRDAERSRN